jgi:hypothetical protein
MGENVVEARVNPEPRAVERTEAEVSAFLVDILDRKVGGVALGIFSISSTVLHSSLVLPSLLFQTPM